MLRACTSIALGLALTVGLCPDLSGAAQKAEDVDPFYLNLLDEALAHYREGQIAEAAEDLTVACFGFLDCPPRLLQGYVYLTLCHHRMRDLKLTRFYVQEIKKLKLEEHWSGSGVPEDVIRQYAEIALKVKRS